MLIVEVICLFMSCYMCIIFMCNTFCQIMFQLSGSTKFILRIWLKFDGWFLMCMLIFYSPR